MLALMPLLSLALPGSIDPSAVLMDQVTGTQFQSMREAGGTGYRCLGAGGHKLFGMKIYAVAFCLDAAKADGLVREYAAARHPGKTGPALADALEGDQGFFEALIRAPADKMIVLRFMRDIPRDRLAGSFVKTLRRYMGPREAERLAGSLNTGVTNGQVAQFHSHGDDLVMQLEQQSKTFEKESATQQLWRVWLGQNSPTPNLRRSIALGAAEQM